MGIEIELKAGLEPADAARLQRALVRLEAVAEPGEKLVAIYYDSEDRRLAAASVALRVRREGGRLVQTVKAGRQALGGFHRARELEAPVAAARPDLSAVPDAALRRQMETLLDGAPLLARFETRVNRRRWLIRHANGLVEVAIDKGEIRAGSARQPVLEAEFELREGSPEALFAVAATLLHDSPARLTLPSKAARGNALALGAPWRAGPEGSRPEPPLPGSDGAECWRAALAVLAPAVATNLEATFTSADPEGPHQLRVALRRLRSAVQLHRPLIDMGVADELAEGARALGRLVAPLRDSDVLTAALIEAGEAEEELARALERQGEAVRAATRQEMRRQGATAFALRLMGLAAIGGWRPDARAEPQPIEALADRALGRLWRRAARLGDRFAVLEDEQRHEFRKLCKKIRYALELVPKRAESKAFGADLKRLQEDLGTLNDLAVLEGWAPPLPEALQPAFGDARARLLKAARQRGDLALGRACRHWRDLRGRERPWG